MLLRAMYISSNGFKSRKHRFLPACCGSLALACLLLMAAFVSCKSATGASDPVVEREQKEFYEAWLRRGLRDDELRKVTDEFIALYIKKGKDRAGIHEATKPFLEYAKILREQDGTPGAVTLRHNLLRANYFDSDMQNTTELRLLTEPDPVRVVDPKCNRLMTETDVIALVNLSIFTKSKGEPHHQEVSNEAIDRVSSKLNHMFNGSKGDRMPRFLTEMASFWTGVRQEWPRLSDDEKRQVRSYSMVGYEAPFKDYKMYGRLLGLNQRAAFQRSMYDEQDAAVLIAKVGLMGVVYNNIPNLIR
ncbi:MAG: hypothetical protein J2P37_30140 [Ktedonobacteraceae bacterium]|nr:hypothetical protein [Ktedonobacteraceae bacterium]